MNRLRFLRCLFNKIEREVFFGILPFFYVSERNVAHTNQGKHSKVLRSISITSLSMEQSTQDPNKFLLSVMVDRCLPCNVNKLYTIDENNDEIDSISNKNLNILFILHANIIEHITPLLVHCRKACGTNKFNPHNN